MMGRDPKSHRCSTCDINYPRFKRDCEVCEGTLWPRFQDGPDSDWKEQVEMKKSWSKERAEEPSPYIPNTECNVAEYADRKWIPHGDLLAAGLSCIETFQVVRVGETFYELQGHVGKTADNLPGGAWWVEEVVVPDAESIPDKFPRAWVSESRKRDKDGG